MRPTVGLIASGLIVLLAATSSPACCGHRSHCRQHRAATRVAYVPATMPVVMPTAPVTYAAPQTAAAPVTVAATAPPAVVQPAYNYEAAPAGQPAYYYTYDSSGKLIIAQWMDWVFRGGRAAGEPAPPLPIIGALQNR